MVWEDVWYSSTGCGWSCCEICFVPIAMLDDRRVLKLKVPGWCETHVRPAYVLAKAISYPPKKLPCIVWALYSASVPPRYLNGCAARKTLEMMKNGLEHVVGKLSVHHWRSTDFRSESMAVSQFGRFFDFCFTCPDWWLFHPYWKWLDRKQTSWNERNEPPTCWPFQSFNRS